MLVNEEDTAEFWCPMTRIYNPTNKTTGYNAVVELKENGDPDVTLDSGVAYCRGASCMMWRYTNSHSDDSEGYCGLAGPAKY